MPYVISNVYLHFIVENEVNEIIYKKNRMDEEKIDSTHVQEKRIKSIWNSQSLLPRLSDGYYLHLQTDFKMITITPSVCNHRSGKMLNPSTR